MQKGPATQADKNKDKLKDKRDSQLVKKEQQLNKLSDEEILAELKQKQLPTFGTKQERLDRLKKFHGITPAVSNLDEVNESVQAVNKANVNTPSNPALKKGPPKGSVLDEIEKLKQKREERRMKMEDKKREKAEKEAENEALGKVGDVDFELMIDKHRFKQPLLQHHVPASEIKLCVCVRKRPIFKKEESAGEIDAISCANPQIVVHECKFKVDGITKYVENNSFTFDNTFNENESNEDIYKYSIMPHVDFILNQGIVTCFAYGQTGSGKTFTMKGVQDFVVRDLFKAAQNKYKHMNLHVCMSFFEIYGGRCYDLLNQHSPLTILEGKNQNVQIPGLVERNVDSMESMLELIEYGNSVRTTHQTVSNDTSSRSHAVCQILLRDPQDKVQGKLLLVDLAGSERAQDTQSNNRARRIEGAEINKSLLALKECIRAMDSNKQGGHNHVPFRASKLTLVLRDSFTAKNDKTRIVMIACISPGSSSADHSLNTLRYADRLKERSNVQIKPIKYEPEAYEDVKPEPDYKSVQKQEPSNVGVGVGVGAGKINKNNIQAEVPEKDSRNYPQKPTENKNDPKGQVKPPKGSEVSKPQANNAVPVKKKGPKAASINEISDKENKKADLDGDESPVNIKKANEDLKYMKETMRKENKNMMSNEYFDFQEKVNAILEEQEEIFSLHMSAIKEDARLLTHESELISNVQGIGVVDYDVDAYVQRLESVIKAKLHIYSTLDKKLSKFKRHLQEEEEISSKVKGTFYY